MRYFFDTEFIEDGKTIDLLSIGIIDENGRRLYLENRGADITNASDWVKTNVVAHLDWINPDHPYCGNTRAEIRDLVLEFVGTEKPEFWAYYADYDWVVMCQLFGTMMDLPKGWPMYCRDVKQFCDMLGNPKLPTQGKGEHHALADAKWTKDAWHFLFAEWERQHNESPTL
jgi:hypothetical protein